MDGSCNQRLVDPTADTCKDIATELCRTALQRNSRDNVSCLMCALPASPHTEADTNGPDPGAGEGAWEGEGEGADALAGFGADPDGDGVPAGFEK